jgi:hypothetical protein
MGFVMLSWNSIRSLLQFALLFAISTFSKGVWLLLAEKINASGQLQAGRTRKWDPKGLTIVPHLCHICEIPWGLDGSKEKWKQTRAQWGGDSHSKLDRHLMYRSVELCPISLMANLCHVLCAGRVHQALRSQFGSVDSRVSISPNRSGAISMLTLYECSEDFAACL